MSVLGFDDLAKEFERINFSEMSTTSIALWLRKHVPIGLTEAIKLAYVVKAAYRLGCIRSEALKK